MKGQSQTGLMFLLLFFSLQGYMLKKGHKRKNWMERWFLLKPNSISYFVHEDLAEQKGEILLDGSCSVEVRAWSGAVQKALNFNMFRERWLTPR